MGNRIKNLTGTAAKAYGYDKLDRLIRSNNELYGYDGPSSLLKFDVYVRKELFWGVWKISEIQNKSFVPLSEQPLFLMEAKHIAFQQAARPPRADSNRSSHTVGATAYAYTYPTTSNRLTSFTAVSPPAATPRPPRAGGNALTTGSGFTFSYDARGRMTYITASSVNQYGINALGQRLTKAGTGYTGTLRFVYGEDGKLIGEYDNTSAAIVEHVYLQDTPIAVLKGTGAYLVQSDHFEYA